MKHESGDYVLDVKELKARETKVIDFREIRDAQTPDKAGRAIPLNVERGQIAWSVYGNANKTLNGRSEQVNLSEGIGTTYDCRNCCPDSFIIDGVIPGSSEVEVGGQINFFLDTRIENCYGSSGSTPMPGSDWLTSDASVGTINSEGLAEGVSPGYVTFTTSWINHVWHFQSIDLDCLVDDIPGGGSGGMQVRPTLQYQFSQSGVPLSFGTPPKGSEPFVKSMTVEAIGTPSGGTYSWITMSNKVTLANTTSNIVTVTGIAESATEKDVIIELSYTLNGQTARAQVKLTVQKPTSMKYVSDSNDGPNTRCDFGENGRQRNIIWQVSDKWGKPIYGFELPTYDTLTNELPNSCNVPEIGEGTAPGPTTGNGGRWNHRYALCSTACFSGGTCQVKGNQRFNINGFNIDLPYIMTCTSIKVNGH